MTPGRPPHNARKQQKWIRGFILVVGAFTLLCFLLADPLLRSWSKRDRLTAAPHEGTAIVAMFANASFDDQHRPTEALVSLRLNGQIVRANTALHLQTGQQVRVLYRVGKSGRIYVDTVQPLP